MRKGSHGLSQISCSRLSTRLSCRVAEIQGSVCAQLGYIKTDRHGLSRCATHKSPISTKTTITDGAATQVSSLTKKMRCEKRRGEGGETTSSRVPFSRPKKTGRNEHSERSRPNGTWRAEEVKGVTRNPKQNKTRLTRRNQRTHSGPTEAEHGHA
jgi:hypothetical protein